MSQENCSIRNILFLKFVSTFLSILCAHGGKSHLDTVVCKLGLFSVLFNDSFNTFSFFLFWFLCNHCKYWAKWWTSFRISHKFSTLFYSFIINFYLTTPLLQFFAKGQLQMNFSKSLDGIQGALLTLSH